MITLDDTRIERFDKIARMRKESTEALMDYWKDYSIYTSLEFWMLIALLLAPLIVLIWKIDRNKIFLIGFFGYSIHMTSLYSNILAVNLGWWHYPIQLIPAIPSFALDSSLVPVTYMLAYQWTINKKKNYYITMLVISSFFAFIFEPLLVKLGLFKVYGSITHFHSLIVYVVIALFAKLITNVFILLQKHYNKSI